MGFSICLKYSYTTGTSTDTKMALINTVGYKPEQYIQ